MFEPYSLTTRSVKEALVTFAKEYSIELTNIDFTLNGYQTLVTDTKTLSTTEISPREIEEHKERLLQTASLIVEQEYNITIIPVSKNAPRFAIRLNVDKMFTKITATIGAESTFSLDNSYDTLFKELEKRKVRNGILLGFCDTGMVNDLTAYCQTIDKVGKITEGTITLCQTPSISLTRNDHLSYNYKERLSNAGNIHLYDRGYMFGTNANETVIEYTKPKQGRGGRNCRGEFIAAEEPIIRAKPEFKPTASLRMEETDDYIRYIANKSGRVIQEGEVLDIQEEMEVDEINVRKTGSLYGGYDCGLKIIVRVNDSALDAIGAGTVVEAGELKTGGGSGSGSFIKSHYVEMGGTVHASSTVECDVAKIGSLRGTLRGNEASIERLENGNVHVDHVKIKQAMGGVIKAKEVRIGTLHSNVQIVASELVEIEHIKGNSNKIFIALFGKDNDDELYLMESARKLAHEINELEKKYFQNRANYDQSITDIKEIKNRILEDQKAGRTPLKSHVEAYKKFTYLVEEIKKEKQKLDILKAKHEKLENEVAHLEEVLLNARIIIHSRWTELNEICFLLGEAGKEIVYSPQEGEKWHTLRLLKINVGEYKIVTE